MQWIENHFGIVLLLSGVAGLFFPLGAIIADETVLFIIATVMFLSYFKMETTITTALISKSLCFSILRFCVLPLVMWAAARLVIPDYALAVLLIALLPAGVASAALTKISGGNVLLAISITLMSSLLAILVIPLYISWASPASLNINTESLFITLLVCIGMPLLLHALLKRNTLLIHFNNRYGKPTSILLIGAVIYIVIAKQQPIITNDPARMVLPCLVAAFCYGCFAISFFSSLANKKERVTYGITSLFNNAALGVGIALLHFPSHIILTLVAAEIVWAMLPLLLQYRYKGQ